MEERQSGVVTRGTAAALLIGVVMAWGLSWPIMKVGLEYVSPLTFACIRNVVAATAMGCISFAAGQARLPSRGDWPLVLSVGAVQIAGFLGLITVALQFVPAGRSAILAFTTPIWVVPLALFVLKEPLGVLRSMGFVLGIGGVAVMFNPAGFDWHDSDVLIGNGLLLFAALLWAFLILQIRLHKWSGSPLSLAPWQMGFGALLLGLSIPILEPEPYLHPEPVFFGVLAYAGLVASAFGVWASVVVTRALPAITVSLGMLASPVVSVVTSVAFFGERLSATNLGGLLLISGGLAAIALAERRGRSATPARVGTAGSAALRVRQAGD